MADLKPPEGTPTSMPTGPEPGRPLVPGPPQSVSPPIKDTTINRGFGVALIASLIVIVALVILFAVVAVAVLRGTGNLR